VEVVFVGCGCAKMGGWVQVVNPMMVSRRIRLVCERGVGSGE
jgi:hypothetical protein